VAFHELPTLVINPGDDRQFRADVRAALAAGADTPHALATRLRDRYPRVVVRRRELSDEAHEVWYVYRDGSWRSGSSVDQARDDFRATSESLVDDAERVRDIELRSAEMQEADPELDELARESEQLTRGMAAKGSHQAQLLRELRERADEADRPGTDPTSLG
jgi:hypothetical protein